MSPGKAAGRPVVVLVVSIFAGCHGPRCPMINKKRAAGVDDRKIKTDCRPRMITEKKSKLPAVSIYPAAVIMTSKPGKAEKRKTAEKAREGNC